jgi:hypothetical protein
MKTWTRRRFVRATAQRSAPHYQKAVRLVQEGAIGEVHKITAGFTRNVMPGFAAREDIARWALGARAPAAVSGFGGRFALKDGGETPAVQEVLYDFPEASLGGGKGAS